MKNTNATTDASERLRQVHKCILASDPAGDPYGDIRRSLLSIMVQLAELPDVRWGQIPHHTELLYDLVDAMSMGFTSLPVDD